VWLLGRARWDVQSRPPQLADRDGVDLTLNLGRTIMDAYNVDPLITSTMDNTQTNEKMPQVLNLGHFHFILSLSRYES
jgi:hypothetical protein